MKTRSKPCLDLLLLSLAILALPAMALTAMALPALASAQDPIPGNAKAQEKNQDKDQDRAPEIEWLTDIAAAKGEAKKAGKPILYYYRCDP
jgi:hypothetical protein